MKLGKDPVTGYPAAHILGKTIILHKDTTASDVRDKGLHEIKECQL